MKRYILLILCALMLGGVAPVRVWADRQVFDVPGDGRLSVGDDDTPIPARSSDPVSVSPRPDTETVARATNFSRARLILDAIHLKLESWFVWTHVPREQANELAAVKRRGR